MYLYEHAFEINHDGKKKLMFVVPSVEFHENQEISHYVGYCEGDTIKDEDFIVLEFIEDKGELIERYHNPKLQTPFATLVNSLKEAINDSD